MLAGVVGGNMANAAGVLSVQEFSETYTISGRQAASGDVVYSLNSDFVVDDISEPTSAAAIWLIKTATDCFIRVGTDVGGDIGDFVFRRLNDMFEFFRDDDAGKLRINPGYWAEKCTAADTRRGPDDDGIREFLHRELPGVTEVHRADKVLVVIHQAHETIN